MVLWNRYLQSFDYRYRPVSLNRDQMEINPDGSFAVVIAHQDPGYPNWLWTEGRNFGLVYWRFLLPEGEIKPLSAEVVAFSEVGNHL